MASVALSESLIMGRWLDRGAAAARARRDRLAPLFLDALNIVAALFPRDVFESGCLNLCRATRGEEFLVSAVAWRVPELLVGAAAAGDADRVKFILDNTGSRRADVANAGCWQARCTAEASTEYEDEIIELVPPRMTATVAEGERFEPFVTPLAVASACGHLRVVQVLIAAGARVDSALQWDFDTDFMLEALSPVSARRPYYLGEGARWLRFVRNGGRPSDPPPLGPLHLAVAAKHFAVARELLNAGAGINRYDPVHPRVPIYFLLDVNNPRTLGDVSFAEFMLHRADLNHFNCGVPPLSSLFIGGGRGWHNIDILLLKQLIRGGARVNERDVESRTPLDWVLSSWHVALRFEPSAHLLTDMVSGYAAAANILIAAGACIHFLYLHDVLPNDARVSTKLDHLISEFSDHRDNEDVEDVLSWLLKQRAEHRRRGL
jgi:ankyrin repeat protein